jgi:hypothetical protein
MRLLCSASRGRGLFRRVVSSAAGEPQILRFAQDDNSEGVRQLPLRMTILEGGPHTPIRMPILWGERRKKFGRKARGAGPAPAVYSICCRGEEITQVQ